MNAPIDDVLERTREDEWGRQAAGRSGWAPVREPVYVWEEPGRRQEWQEQLARGSNPDRIAGGLAVFSMGLGLLQLAAPRQVAEWAGLPEERNMVNLLRAAGVREIASGLAIFAGATPGVWARILGDGMDLALLADALRDPRADRGRVATAAAVVAGTTLLDLFTADLLNKRNAMGPDAAMTPTRRVLGERGTYGSGFGGGFGNQSGGTHEGMGNTLFAEDKGIEIERSITVGLPPEQVYAYWHNFENLPRFMLHLEAVEVLDGTRSRWTAKAPLGMSVAWDAVITEDIPNQLIAWQSVEGADVENAGIVRFQPAPGDRGTEVHVQMRYSPPAGRLGSLVARLLGEEPHQQVRDDLRRFKMLLETGEIARSEGSLDNKERSAQPPRKNVDVPDYPATPADTTPADTTPVAEAPGQP